MEPFALMQILQSLFTQKNTPPADANNVPMQNTPAPPPEKTEPAPVDAAPPQANNSDAFLDFIQAHEQRAKRLRKP